MADLALEGGGVKGIGLVGAVLVLDEAGYRFRGVAGTSAGAIAACLVAAVARSGQPMATLRALMSSVGSLLSDAAILSERMGVYSGDYLAQWLTPRLSALGVHTYEDLKLPDDDPGRSLPDGHDYRLVVHVSDITRGQLVRLPWDYPMYGWDPGAMDVVAAVRASMSIPFFFEPVTFTTRAADVPVPTPDGRRLVQHYEAGTVTWVDGGMLRNCPIQAFDRVDGKPPRWPTIGIKLSSLPTRFGPTEACTHSASEAVHCLRTMMNEWDSSAVDATSAGRTIFVDNGGLTATDFDLTPDQQQMLFLNGVEAATLFVIEMARRSGVPRTGDDSAALMHQRWSSDTA